MSATPLLVLGLGNLLLEDDGVGSAAVALLNDRYAAPEGVRVSRRRHARPVAAAVSRRRRRRRSSSTPSGPTGSRATFVRLDGDEVPSGRGDAPVATSSGRRRPARWRALARSLSAAPRSCSASCRNPWSWRSGSRRRVRPALPALVERIVEEARDLGLRTSAARLLMTRLAGRSCCWCRSCCRDAADVDRDLPRAYRRIESRRAALLARAHVRGPRALSRTLRALPWASAATGMASGPKALTRAPRDFTNADWRRSTSPRRVFFAIREGLARHADASVEEPERTGRLEHDGVRALGRASAASDACHDA